MGARIRGKHAMRRRIDALSLQREHNVAKTGLRNTLHSTLICALGMSVMPPSMAAPAENSGSGSQGQVTGFDSTVAGGEITEVVVTARRRQERLQDVPDSITAFTAEAIEKAGITKVIEFAALTPNLNFLGGASFRSGYFNMSMRGIGNSQEGWPSVSFIVDGVPTDSADGINSSGSLAEVERIEVLRGPQSALYGFNAIAGAINIITKAPSNEWTATARALYGKGDDRQFGGSVSGPIIADKLSFRLAAGYRENDGLIDSATNGIPLAFNDQRNVTGRLLFTPSDRLTIDVNGSYVDESNGASYQGKISSSAIIDDWSAITRPRRAYAGEEQREQYRLSTRVQWDFDSTSLVGVVGYSKLDQNLRSSVCYDDPNDPALPGPDGGAQCLFGPAYGDAALPGQAIDTLYDGRDDIRSTTADLRLQSRGDGVLEWTIGASALHREYLAGFDAGNIVAPDRSVTMLTSTWNLKEDDWWGVYGQLMWRATDKLELMVAARYDHETYENTSYTDRTESTVIPVQSNTGELVNTQQEEATKFQPKGQISYHFTDDVMGYLTVSRGFRAGFFSSRRFTLPEHTTNYELGLKTMFWNRRINLNLAAFRIDYSNQQFSTVVATPPYRVAVSIPETEINGVEIESTFTPSPFVSLSAGLGYLDAEVRDGTRSPSAPKYNASLSADFSYPMSDDWTARLHVDGRYNSSQYLARNNLQHVPAKTFANLRAGVDNGKYDIAAFVRNVTDEHQAAMSSSDNFTGGYPRHPVLPRSYGMEVKVSF